MKLEQDDSVLLTDLDDSAKERMGFLKVCFFFGKCTSSLPRNSLVSTSLAFYVIFAQCIKGTNRLRAAVKVVDAEKTAGSAVSRELAEKYPESDTVFSELSPLIYHESECDLSSQVKFKSLKQQLLFVSFHSRNVQVHILLLFIPPHEAVKLHVLFNVYVQICVEFN